MNSLIGEGDRVRHAEVLGSAVLLRISAIADADTRFTLMA
jgi:hypothetical protein